MVLILECHIWNNYQYRIFTTWQAIPFKRKFYYSFVNKFLLTVMHMLGIKKHNFFNSKFRLTDKGQFNLIIQYVGIDLEVLQIRHRIHMSYTDCLVVPGQ